MYRLLLSISLLAISTATWADVKLLVDDYIKVTAINGQEINQGVFTPLQREFTLNPGTNVITARYDRLFNLTRDNHDYLRSKDVTVSAQLADNQTYHLTMPNSPERYSDAVNYAKAPTLAITQNTQVISEQSASASSNSGLFANIGALFERNDKAVSQNQAVVQAVQSTTNTQHSTLDQFMQLWLNASETERQKIREWVQQ